MMAPMMTSPGSDAVMKSSAFFMFFKMAHPQNLWVD
jgi:hypothetical protein